MAEIGDFKMFLLEVFNTLDPMQESRRTSIAIIAWAVLISILIVETNNAYVTFPMDYTGKRGSFYGKKLSAYHTKINLLQNDINKLEKSVNWLRYMLEQKQRENERLPHSSFT
ncbi:uncharacterized protein LOC116804144 [Drosophila mojavensis]|uniref:uncharacterized protein LOC116804144 n=1 Tax=Drosophila mojavensis TaxID=7230 RepID=UPI001CD0B43B|nr:uncharacterized protein LOC116804144 [Drosophila mojavensis]